MISRHLKWVIGLLLLALPSAWALTITSPAPNSSINGPITFTVDTGGNNNIVSVEYLLNGQTFSGRLATPFVYNWNTTEIWDTQANVTALAYDINGTVIDQDTTGVTFYVVSSSAVPYVKDPAQPAIMSLLQPDISQPLSGIVTWKIAENFTTGSVWDCTLDGRMLYGYPSYANPPFTYPMDTTLLANGPHVMYCHLLMQPTNLSLAMQYWNFTVNNPTGGPGAPNGTPDSQIRMSAREVFMVPGETATLTAYAVTNTGQKVSAGAISFQEAPPSELQANNWFSPQHPVHVTNNTSSEIDFVAVSTGVTSVNAYSATFQSTATARIIVNEAHVLPHFSKSGDFFNSYQPGQSVYVRAPFGFSANDQNGAIGAASGVNTFSQGIYGNPADGSQSQNIPVNIAGVTAHFQQLSTLANQYGMSFLFTGDDIARTTNELYDSVYDATSTAKIRADLTGAQSTGRTIGIDMVDETDLLWGEDPTPAQTSFAGNLPPEPGVWSTRTPSVGDDAFFTLMNIMTHDPNNHNTTTCPNLTWPTLGFDSDYYHLPQPANWMADPRFADYATVYSTPLGPDSTYPNHPSLDSIIHLSQSPSDDWGQDILRRERPMLALISMMGVSYTKMGPGFQYTPGQDILTGPASRPLDVAAQVTFHAIRGMAGVRAYMYDGYTTPFNTNDSQATIGSGIQDGTSATGNGADRWQGLASASKYIQNLEPYLLNPQKNSPDLGPSLVTTVRESTAPASRMLMILNYSEGPKDVWVDVSSYVYVGSSTYFTRFHQVSNTDSEETLAYSTLQNGATDHITVQGGETVAWLFTSGQNTPPNTIPPDAPTGLTAQTTSWYAVQLSWNENNISDPDPIKDYLVFRNGLQVAEATSTVFLDGDLTGLTTYFYQVRARDIHDLVSGLSNAVWATTFQIPDLLEPWIKNVQVSSITSNTALVTWTTDKLSDSQVEYSSSTSSANDANQYSNQSPINSTMTVTHSVQLAGLASGTVYYFRVKSRAQSNSLLAISTPYTFVTLFNGQIVGSIRINAGGPGFVDKSSHTWIADQFYDQGVGSLPLLAGTTIANTIDNTVYLTNHSDSNFTYTVPIANGYYNVQLDFAETDPKCTSNGCRVINANLNGQQIISSLDIFKTVGADAAYNYITPVPIQVTNQQVTVNFNNAVPNLNFDAAVSGIEILLNCADPTTIPTPQLNLPTYMPIQGTMQIQYNPQCNIDHFEWTLALQSNVTGTGTGSGNAAAPSGTSTPTSAFATPGVMADLSLQPPVPPGYYRVGVKAVSQAGTVSGEGVSFTNLVANQLGGARVYPNPWRVDRPNNGGVVMFDTLTLSAKIRIFDVAGHHVRTLPTTAGMASWDLKNESGENVASGIYIYLLTDNSNQKVTGKLVVIR